MASDDGINTIHRLTQATDSLGDVTDTSLVLLGQANTLGNSGEPSRNRRCTSLSRQRSNRIINILDIGNILVNLVSMCVNTRSKTAKLLVNLVTPRLILLTTRIYCSLNGLKTSIQGSNLRRILSDFTIESIKRQTKRSELLQEMSSSRIIFISRIISCLFNFLNSSHVSISQINTVTNGRWSLILHGSHKATSNLSGFGSVIGNRQNILRNITGIILNSLPDISNRPFIFILRSNIKTRLIRGLLTSNKLIFKLTPKLNSRHKRHLKRRTRRNTINKSNHINIIRTLTILKTNVTPIRKNTLRQTHKPIIRNARTKRKNEITNNLKVLIAPTPYSREKSTNIILLNILNKVTELERLITLHPHKTNMSLVTTVGRSSHRQTDTHQKTLKGAMPSNGNGSLFVNNGTIIIVSKPKRIINNTHDIGDVSTNRVITSRDNHANGFCNNILSMRHWLRNVLQRRYLTKKTTAYAASTPAARVRAAVTTVVSHHKLFYGVSPADTDAALTAPMTRRTPKIVHNSNNVAATIATMVSIVVLAGHKKCYDRVGSRHHTLTAYVICHDSL